MWAFHIASDFTPPCKSFRLARMFGTLNRDKDAPPKSDQILKTRIMVGLSKTNKDAESEAATQTEMCMTSQSVQTRTTYLGISQYFGSSEHPENKKHAGKHEHPTLLNIYARPPQEILKKQRPLPSLQLHEVQHRSGKLQTEASVESLRPHLL